MAHTILRLPAVKAATGLSRTSIYNKLDANSPYHDPSFPKPIRLGARAVGWDEESVQVWIDQQIKQSRAGREAA